MAVLPTNRVSGDVIESADIDAIATQVNANTTAITDLDTNKVNLDGTGITDAEPLLTALGIGNIVVVASTGVTSRLWIQANDPDTTNPGEAADGDLWIQPTA